MDGLFVCLFVCLFWFLFECVLFEQTHVYPPGPTNEIKRPFYCSIVLLRPGSGLIIKKKLQVDFGLLAMATSAP